MCERTSTRFPEIANACAERTPGACRNTTTTGGTVRKTTGFEEVILNQGRRDSVRIMADQLRETLPETGLKEPYDVELGFKGDQLWLFQVRPFVENKRAASSEYLRSITPAIPDDRIISLEASL